jgi:hypothetical protein
MTAILLAAFSSSLPPEKELAIVQPNSIYSTVAVLFKVSSHVPGVMINTCVEEHAS